MPKFRIPTKRPPPPTAPAVMGMGKKRTGVAVGLDENPKPKTARKNPATEYVVAPPAPKKIPTKKKPPPPEKEEKPAQAKAPVPEPKEAPPKKKPKTPSSMTAKALREYFEEAKKQKAITPDIYTEFKSLLDKWAETKGPASQKLGPLREIRELYKTII